MLCDNVLFFLVFAAGGSFFEVEGYGYSLGECPVVEPQSDFRMDKMLGEWYVIQKTSTASSCITYNFTTTEAPYAYLLEETSQNFALKMAPFRHEIHYTGKLVVEDDNQPAKMVAKFPLTPGTATYVVFMTDYTNYAAIFTCQKLGFVHRYAATILSRDRSLNKMYADKIRTRLSSFGVDPYDLSIIPQSDCPDGGVNIAVDPDTFSMKSVTGVASRAWGKIGDGVNYVANGAKNVFRKDNDVGNHDLGTQEVIFDKDTNRYRMADPKAEWLP